MAAPEYVPRPKAEKSRVYESPPWRPEPWLADRPADLTGSQPLGDRLGSPGPDLGFMLKLARRFEGQLSLAPGEHEDDAISGCSAVAMKRSSLFGRAPVIHDLTVAFTLYGFLADQPDPDQVAMRRPLFEEVRLPHHYVERRQLVDLVPEEVLRLGHEQLIAQAARDWRSLFRHTPAATA